MSCDIQVIERDKIVRQYDIERLVVRDPRHMDHHVRALKQLRGERRIGQIAVQGRLVAAHIAECAQIRNHQRAAGCMKIFTDHRTDHAARTGQNNFLIEHLT